MARISEGTFRNWTDKDKVDAADYRREQEIIRQAINDTQDQVDEWANMNDDALGLEEAGLIFAPLTAVNDLSQRTEEAISLAGQTVTRDALVAEVGSKVPLVVDEKLVPINERIDDRGISLKDFILAVEPYHDRAFQRANDHIRQLAVSSNFENVPSLRIPTGKYIWNQEAKQSPFVKVKPEGFVGIQTTYNGSAIWIAPNSDDPKYNNAAGVPIELAKLVWNRGKYLDGSNGAFWFTTTIDRASVGANTVAIEVGDRNAASDIRNAVSRYVIENVNVFGFHKAIKNNAVNNYIGTFKNCHFESNNHHVTFESPTASQINSGENMIFENCIFAGADKESILIDAPGHDITFENCSFDFNNSAVIKSRRSGTSIRMNNCYVEKIGPWGNTSGDQILYHSESTSSGETNGRNTFYANKLIVYLKRPSTIFKNTPNSQPGYINLYLDIDGLEVRYQDTNHLNPYVISDRFLVDSPKVFFLGKKIFNATIVKSLLSKDLNLLRNGDFARSVIATDLTVQANDPYWFNSYKAAISNPTIVQEGTGDSLCIRYNVTTPGTNSMKLDYKFMLNVEAGEMILMSALIKVDKISTKNDIQYRLECYDDNGTLVETLNYNDAIITTADRINGNLLNNSTSDPLVVAGTVYNVDGANFRMLRSVGTFSIPYGVVKIKPYIIINNMDSTSVHLDDIHVTKSK